MQTLLQVVKVSFVYITFENYLILNQIIFSSFDIAYSMLDNWSSYNFGNSWIHVSICQKSEIA